MFVEFVESSFVVCHNILQYGLRKMKSWYLSKVSGFYSTASKEDMPLICKSIRAVKWN